MQHLRPLSNPGLTLLLMQCRWAAALPTPALSCFSQMKPGKAVWPLSHSLVSQFSSQDLCLLWTTLSSAFLSALQPAHLFTCICMVDTDPQCKECPKHMCCCQARAGGCCLAPHCCLLPSFLPWQWLQLLDGLV